MKAVILAAGVGKRMLPLTLKVPKSLLRINGRTVLDYIFEALPQEVDSVVIVVGYLKKKIQQHLGMKFQGRPIRYVVQNILDGSAKALFCCKDLFLPNERFLLIYGDELPTQKEVIDCAAKEFSWLCCPAENPHQSGIATIASDGKILEVIEKPKFPVSNMSAAGIMMINSDIFNYEPIQHPNGEYYLSSLMRQFIKEHDVYAVHSRMRPAFISPDELEKITFDQFGVLMKQN
ncbi:nucleotidyltransferase family protein [Candidatus Peregrinibacteria bacterium]|nr:nucleotidyltransferase family protein [Candidatus Peregrinibacteria bacterium]